MNELTGCTLLELILKCLLAESQKITIKTLIS